MEFKTYCLVTYAHASDWLAKAVNPKRCSTYLLPEAAYCSCSSAVWHRAGVQSRLKPTLTDFGLQPYVALFCRF